MARSLAVIALALAGAASAARKPGATLRGKPQRVPLPGAAGACSPDMFWVNYFDSPDEMLVSWTTPCKAEAVVNYGTSSGALSMTATGPEPQTYTFNSYTSPYIYHVRLANLTLGTQYYYTVGGPTSGVSAVMNFVSHPGVGADVTAPGGGDITFALIGDLGQTSNSATTLAHVDANDAITSIIHVGDLSYADSLEQRWDSWQQLTKATSSRVPWMTLVGNHEIESYSTDFLAYASRFQMPAPAKDPENVWYSIDIGPAHWIMASTYHPLAAGTPQYAWLEADLAAVDRTKTPWVFFASHAPWYNSNTAHQNDGAAQMAAWEDIIYKAGVDAAFFGHVHAYERNHRVYNGQRDPKAPIYITIGDGGNREGLATKWLPQPDYSAYRNATFGHATISIVNSTCAFWAWQPNPDLASIIEDPVWLCKGRDAQPAPIAEYLATTRRGGY